MLILICFAACELGCHSKHNMYQVWYKLSPAAQKRGFARGHNLRSNYSLASLSEGGVCEADGRSHHILGALLRELAHHSANADDETEGVLRLPQRFCEAKDLWEKEEQASKPCPDLRRGWQVCLVPTRSRAKKYIRYTTFGPLGKIFALQKAFRETNYSTFRENGQQVLQPAPLSLNIFSRRAARPPTQGRAQAQRGVLFCAKQGSRRQERRCPRGARR